MDSLRARLLNPALSVDVPPHAQPQDAPSVHLAPLSGNGTGGGGGAAGAGADGGGGVDTEVITPAHDCAGCASASAHAPHSPDPRDISPRSNETHVAGVISPLGTGGGGGGDAACEEARDGVLRVDEGAQSRGALECGPVTPPWMEVLEPYIREYTERYAANGGPSVVGSGSRVDLAMEAVVECLHANDMARGEECVRRLMGAVSEGNHAMAPLHESARNGRFPLPQLAGVCTSPTTPQSHNETAETPIPTFPYLGATNGPTDNDNQPPMYLVHGGGGGGGGGGTEIPQLPVDMLSKVVVRREKRARKIKKYTRPVPSKHCHICARAAGFVELAVCRNINDGLCRKTTCDKCFLEFGWDWAAATSGEAGWVCTHCRGNCPDRAQCVIYKRTNDRRRMTGAAAAGAGLDRAGASSSA